MGHDNMQINTNAQIGYETKRNLFHEIIYRYLTMVKYVFDIFELIIMTSTDCRYFKRENMNSR